MTTTTISIIPTTVRELAMLNVPFVTSLVLARGSNVWVCDGNASSELGLVGDPQYFPAWTCP